MIGKFIKGFKEGQKEFGDAIAAIINSILLTIVYVFGVGITSIFARLFGKKFLDADIDKNVKTYWQDLDIKTNKMEEYYRQF